MESKPIYSQRPAEVFVSLETSPGGLSPEEAESRQALFGLNLLSEEKRPTFWQRLFTHALHPQSAALLAAGLAALIARQPFLGLSIWALVIINSGFSLWRNYRAEQAIYALRRLLPEYTRLLRGGVVVSVPASLVAPGDVLVLAEGDNIPADARVVEEYGLRTNNATLTGDAVPGRKSADASLRDNVSELERPNLVFAGTSVVSGTGRAVVYATGMFTQFGRIAHLTQSVRDDVTPIQAEMQQLVKRITIIAFIIGLVVLAVGVLDDSVNLESIDALLLGVGIIVAAIPEGLPATLTLALAMAGQRLAQKGVLVKKLSVLETLGVISTICTDKSGTLTQNQMTVRDVWLSSLALKVSGVGYEPVGDYAPAPQGRPWEVDLDALLVAVMCCTNARLIPPGPGKPNWSYLGDQTEAAMQVAAIKGGMDEKQIQRDFPRIHELPFDARRKLMTTIHQVNSRWQCLVDGSIDAPIGGTPAFYPRVAFTKGAPREVLGLCSHILVEGKALPLTPAMRQEIVAALDDYAGRALRVLGVARRCLPGTKRSFSVETVENSLTFLGLMAMHDPPRPGVPEAIETLRGAGIRMVMITGDYGLTALSLARRVGMLVSENPKIVTGAEVDALNEFELEELLGQPELLFARMAPEHKLRIVAAIQALGEAVAVTGDGVNDAPALRKADVGISMGISGTDVSKEAADLILTNDDFTTVVDAIREGRTLYDNLRKFITYIFSSNVPEVFPFLLTITTHIPLALGLEQVLAIDLGTDVFPALGLGSEKPEPDVMNHPPRRRDRPLVTPGLLRRAFLWLGMIETALCYSGFMLVYYLADRLGLIYRGLSQIHPPANLPFGLDMLQTWSNYDLYRLAVTVFYAGVVMAQMGNAFASRAERNRSSTLGWWSNRTLWAGVILSVVQLLFVVYIPVLARIFDHRALPWVFWLWIAPFALFIYGLEWIRKAFIRRANYKKETIAPRNIQV